MVLDPPLKRTHAPLTEIAIFPSVLLPLMNTVSSSTEQVNSRSLVLNYSLLPQHQTPDFNRG